MGQCEALGLGGSSVRKLGEGSVRSLGEGSVKKLGEGNLDVSLGDELEVQNNIPCAACLEGQVNDADNSLTATTVPKNWCDTDGGKCLSGQAKKDAPCDEPKWLEKDCPASGGVQGVETAVGCAACL